MLEMKDLLETRLLFKKTLCFFGFCKRSAIPDTGSFMRSSEESCMN